MSYPQQISPEVTVHEGDSHRRTVPFWLTSLGCVIFFGAGLYAGNVLTLRSVNRFGMAVPEIQSVINIDRNVKKSTVNFDQFWSIWDIIKKQHVDQPVSDVPLFYGAIEGLVHGLGDPYSVYFPPKEAQEFSRDLSGQFEGIGAEIGMKGADIVVIAPLPQSPAMMAGLKTGDKILAIDGKDVHGQTIEEVVKKIRGPVGSIVTLTITRNGFQTVKELKVARAKITVPTVIWEQKKNNIYYVRISYFNQDTGVDFDKVARDIMRRGAKGIVLDMRSNPGGYLDTSVDVASEWIQTGLVVRERFSDQTQKDHSSSGQHRLVGVPTAVLIDNGTASGAEIVAGALQDYGVATLIGQKTYGKGSVQELTQLSDGSALKLTVARWYTPRDRQIDHEGIKPDVVFETPEAATTTISMQSTSTVEVSDEALIKAIEFLQMKKH